MKILFAALSVLLVLGGLIGLLGEEHSMIPVFLIAIGMAGIGIAAYNRR